MTVVERRPSPAGHDVAAEVHVAVGEALSALRSEGLSAEDERALTRKVIAEHLRERARVALAAGDVPLSAEDEDLLAQAVFDRLHGLGGIQPLLEDPDVRDIHISGWDGVWLSLRDGTKVAGPAVAVSDAELIELVATAARRLGRSERRWDYAHPELNLQLPNGDRLHALMAVTGRPTITIRRHDFTIHRLAQLNERGTLDAGLVSFLSAAVRAKCNIVVAGGTGTGKTTLLRCLLNEVPRNERIITIEDSLEIGLEHFADLHPDFETIEAREANTEGVGAFSLADGVRAALRMDPDRVIVGEVRGGEVLPMLLAMSQGNDGSMCSIHADSSRGVFGRLAMYAAMTRERLEPDVTNLLVANAVDVIVHLGWVGGTRRMTSVREVRGGVESGQVVSNELWAPAGDGRARPSGVASAALVDRLASVGFDRRILVGGDGGWSR